MDKFLLALGLIAGIITCYGYLTAPAHDFRPAQIAATGEHAP